MGSLKLFSAVCVLGTAGAATWMLLLLGAYNAMIGLGVVVVFWAVPYTVFVIRTLEARPKQGGVLKKGDAPPKYARAPSPCALALTNVVALFLCAVVTAFYSALAIQMAPSYGGALSPCGQSSCTHNSCTDSGVYNPLGFFPDVYGSLNPFATTKQLLCPCPSCRWADATANSTIFGYPGQPLAPLVPDRTQAAQAGSGLATTNPDDYVSLAFGVQGGACQGFGNMVNGGTSCPGVVALINPQGLIGRGVPVCAVCLDYFRQFSSYDLYFDQCLQQPQQLWHPCWLCPSFDVCDKMDRVLLAYLYLTFGLVISLPAIFLLP